jgi:hypothetical protein
MPVPGTWFWSGDGSSDTVGGLAGTGISSIVGHKADLALVDLLVTNWNGLSTIEFRAQVKNNTFDSTKWLEIDPAISLDSAISGGRWVSATGGRVTISKNVGTTTGIRLVVPIGPADAFRFGFACGDFGTRDVFAMTAGFELVSRLYS